MGEIVLIVYTISIICFFVAESICRKEDWQMNEISGIENNDIMSKFKKTENILNDVQNIIEVSQKEAYRAVNTILSQRNWLIGYRIAEEEMAGENRAEYGASIIKKLSKELTVLYGNEQLFASKYKLYLPTEEELREEIETQKAIFYLQQKETEDCE